MKTAASPRSGSSSRSTSVPSNAPPSEDGTRKRKGSLRKAALLGSGAMRFEDRNRAPVSSRKSPSKGASKAGYMGGGQQPASTSDPATEHVSENDATTPNAVQSNAESHGKDSMLASPDGSFYHAKPAAEDNRARLGPIKGLVQRSASSSSRDSTDLPSATSHTSHSQPPQVEEWDYSSTERWGWVILFSTWIVFVVGIGSCFGVWSWAWDVGETPYAPPELEDDPTLPIVGYYPALIVLSGVMCWVWVIVAWVGMKYFKHAKIQGDDA